MRFKLDNIQLFASILYNVTINFDNGVEQVKDDTKGGIYGVSGETKKNYSAYTEYLFTITLKDDYILDSVASSTSTVEITNITSNTFQLSNSSDGTANVYITTKQAETTTTLPKGTYTFVAMPTLPTSGKVTQSLAFEILSEEGSMFGTQISYGALTDEGTAYNGISYTLPVGETTEDFAVYDTENGWGAENVKTIVISTNQTVTQSFYDWFMSNIDTTPRISAGTYNFIENPATPDVFTQNLNFTSNNISFTKMQLKNDFGTMYGLYYDTGEVATTTTAILTFKNPNYRVIEISETQEVSQDFKDWFESNTTNGTSVVIKKGKYLFNEELTEQDGFYLVLQNAQIKFSHIDFTQLVFYYTSSTKQAYLASDSNTTYLMLNGTWFNPQSRQIEFTADYDITANNSSLSTKDALLIEDWFEFNTSKGIEYYRLNVNGKQCNTWNGHAINKFNGNYIERKYNLIGAYSNVTDNSYAKPSVIYSTDSVQLVLSANGGYEVNKNNLVVQNAKVAINDVVSDNENVMAYIYNPTGTVSVSLQATAKNYTITTTLSNCVGKSDNPTLIQYGGGTILYFTANDGYELPNGVELTNITSYNWDKTTGKLVLAKPTGNVTIKIEAVETAPQLATPQNVSVENNIVSWDGVGGAEQYDVYVDGTIYAENVIESAAYQVDVSCGSACSIYDNETLLKSGTTAYTATISSGIIKIVVDSSASIDKKASTGGVTLQSSSGNTLIYNVTDNGTINISTIEF